MTVLRSLLCGAAWAAVLACSTADLKGPPATSSGTAGCGDAPQIPCDAGAAGPGCVGAPRSTTGGPTYPIGCRAYFTAPDCSTESSCSCVPADGGAQWTCDP